MKKLYYIFIALLPLLLHAEVIVTINNGNIENVSDIDTTDNVIYFIHDYQTKTIDKKAVVAIILDDGKYITLSHNSNLEDANSEYSSPNPKNTSSWVDLQVGALMTFSDGTQGIVFYSDDKGHGLVVSLKETRAKWDLNRKKDMIDIPEIQNSENAFPYISQLGEGAEHTAAILRHLPSYLCPAAYWCTAIGEGWYLPTASELVYLLRVANGGQEEKGPISLAITTHGGTKIDGGWYWTSSETDRTEVLNISDSGSVSTENKSEENAVRAIRAY